MSRFSLETEPPAEIGEPVRSEFIAENRALMVRRAQFAIALLLGFNVLFALADAKLTPDYLFALYSLKAVQVLVLSVALLFLRTSKPQPHVAEWSVLVATSPFVLVALQVGVTGEPITLPLTVILVGLISASLMPWGTGSQILSMSAAAICLICDAIWRAHGGQAVVGYQQVVMVGALLAPVFLTSRLEADRIELWRIRWAQREGEKRFRELAENILDIFWVWDAQFTELRYLSPAFESLLGHPREAVFANPLVLFDYLVEEDRMILQRALARITRGESSEAEYRVVRADGAIRWIWGRGYPIRDASGRVERMVGIWRDITERKRAEDERAALLDVAQDLGGTLELDSILERVHAHLRRLLPCDSAMTVRWDPERQVYYPIAEHGSGVAHDPLMQMSWAGDVTAAEFLARGQVLVLNDTREPSVFPGDLLRRFGVGSVMAAPLEIRGERPMAALFVFHRARGAFGVGQENLFRGITSQLRLAMDTADLYRQQKESASMSSALSRFGEEVLAGAGDSGLPDRLCRAAAVAMQADHCIVFLADAEQQAFIPVGAARFTPEQWEALRVLHYPFAMMENLVAVLERDDLAEVPGDDDSALLPPLVAQQGRDMGFAHNLYVPLRQGGQMLGVLQVSYLASSGAQFGSNGVTGGGGTIGTSGRALAHGVARIAPLALETARLFGELAKANDVKSHFTATLSHELRNLIAALRGYTFALRRGKRLGDVDSKTVEHAESCARELGELVNATLDLSRFEARRVPLDLQDIDLAEFVNELAVELGPAAESAGLSFGVRLEAGQARLRTDRLKLRMIVRNLVTNAIKFTDNGSVTLVVQPRDEVVELAVRDTGAGIPADALGDIFRPFEQAHGEQSRSKGGVGLGLYLAQRLSQILGGEVTVESAVGRGSEFRVRLPRNSESVERRVPETVREGEPILSSDSARRFATSEA